MNVLLSILLILASLAPAAAAEDRHAMHEHLVKEPVFGGAAFILEAGRGNSPTVLLVHGLGDLASGTWTELIPELAREYHVLAVDLPGFGRSSKGNALYSPERYAAFLHWVIERYTDTPPIVVGHSLGGAVSLRYAAAYPKGLSRLVIVDSAGILHRLVVTREMVEPNLRERWPDLPARPALGRVDSWIEGLLTKIPELPVDVDQVLASELLRGSVLSGDPARIAALALVQEDFSAFLREIRTPTAILWGAEDRVTPLRTGLLLESVLPQARLQVIPGAGHVPMFDQPLLFAQSLKAALSQPVTPLPPPPPAATAVGVCRNQSGLTFTGAYERLEISGCSDVRLHRFSAREVAITRSRVILDQGRIAGPGTPLRIADSAITATGLHVEGDTALTVAGSRLDLAGATLLGKNLAVTAERPSRIIFSVSRAESENFKGYLHGRWEVAPGRGW